MELKQLPSPQVDQPSSSSTDPPDLSTNGDTLPTHKPKPDRSRAKATPEAASVAKTVVKDRATPKGSAEKQDPNDTQKTDLQKHVSSTPSPSSAQKRLLGGTTLTSTTIRQTKKRASMKKTPVPPDAPLVEPSADQVPSEKRPSLKPSDSSDATVESSTSSKPQKKRARTSKTVRVGPGGTTPKQDDASKPKKRAPSRKKNKSDVATTSLQNSTPEASPQAAPSGKNLHRPSDIVTPVPHATSVLNPLQPSSSQSNSLHGLPPGHASPPNLARNTSPTEIRRNSNVSNEIADPLQPSLKLDRSASLLLSLVRSHCSSPEMPSLPDFTTTSHPHRASDHLSHFLDTHQYPDQQGAVEADPVNGEQGSPSKPPFANLQRSPPRTHIQPGLLHVVPRNDSMTSIYEHIYPSTH